MKSKLLFSIMKKDLKVDYFSGTGAGGQHRNKHQNCVRIRHGNSGAITTGQSHKERSSNIKEALNNLVKNPKFRIWKNRMVYEIIAGETLEAKVARMMSPKNLKTEVREKGKWVQV